MARIVVVGAGVGGLAAAARLAAAGHVVTVCEQAPELGGKLGWFSRDGFSFDTGPSLLTMPEVFEELFTATGGALAASVELRRLDPIASYRFTDGSGFAARAGDDDLRAELDDTLYAGAGAEWARFDAHAAKVWEVTRDTFLSGPMSAGRLLRLAGAHPGGIGAVTAGRTLRGVAARYLSDDRLRMFVERYATYTGSDPRRAPAALAVIAHIERRYGGWYVPGGLYRLGEAIAERARERRAEIRLDTPVMTISRGPGGRVDGVILADGGRLPADVVVANADAATVYGGLLAGSAGGRPGRWLAGRATPSLSGFALLLALGPPTNVPATARTIGPGGTGHHTVLFPADYDAEFDAVFRGRLPTDPTVYVSAPADPALAPAGCSAWFVLVNAPPHDPGPGRAGIDWDRPGLTATYAARVLELMAARGLDVRDRLRWYEPISPADLERRTGTPGGSIYGSSSNGARAAFLRPANRTAVPGLFLVGGSSHPGGGLPLVALSARIVADLVGPA
ncbi:phytoene desaturase [Frankia sp. AgB1.9]|uniref:phytoene desaturase family protein n=1 Tax=unclassified Frankia TaxID=2632575 RepID=UPI00193420D8|nr:MULTISPECIES: phytoene desaturase family protein [unclassified Frankia]MBL7488721.1 phytoene desaturase [Frankia sp. AgW1.1]MBL7546797.1 phytoene desaturase [Frankia sp. AgB1.9]MBL7623590.1 phytoene desaturase [Frankia sp. AgB1.8]